MEHLVPERGKQPERGRNAGGIMDETLILAEGRSVTILPGGDAELFYSNSTAEGRCIGHLRLDVDSCGKLWTSWWPHEGGRQYNREPFRREFDAMINALQRGLFSKPRQILGKLLQLGIPSLDGDVRYRFFHIDTDACSYYFRVYPGNGDYSYCYCYAREPANQNTAPAE